MRKLKFLSSLAMTVTLSGCALSPQLIHLDSTYDHDTGIGAVSAPRPALIRVNDQRNNRYLGSRGGIEPDASPLIAEPDLNSVLTTKLTETFQALGYGEGESSAIKVELIVDRLSLVCNEGWWVSQCNLDIAFTIAVADGPKAFQKPFSLSQQRSVLTAPRKGYNEAWINGSVDQLWKRIFADKAVQQALAISA